MPAHTPPGTVILYDNDGSNPVYLRNLAQPWPDISPVYQRIGSSHQMICGWDSSANKVIPGEVVHFDMGYAVSSGVIEVHVPYVDATLKAQLEAKFNLMTPIRLTPDGGSTLWQVVWADGESLVFEPFEGFHADWKATLRFKIVKRLS
jgi:hypothetical protein